jgi:hypothetical protein
MWRKVIWSGNCIECLLPVLGEFSLGFRAPAGIDPDQSRPAFFAPISAKLCGVGRWMIGLLAVQIDRGKALPLAKSGRAAPGAVAALWARRYSR